MYVANRVHVRIESYLLIYTFTTQFTTVHNNCRPGLENTPTVGVGDRRRLQPTIFECGRRKRSLDDNRLSTTDWTSAELSMCVKTPFGNRSLICLRTYIVGSEEQRPVLLKTPRQKWVLEEHPSPTLIRRFWCKTESMKGTVGRREWGDVQRGLL